MNWPYPGAAWYVAVVRGLQVMPVDCLHAGMWYVRMCVCACFGRQRQVLWSLILQRLHLGLRMVSRRCACLGVQLLFLIPIPRVTAPLCSCVLAILDTIADIVGVPNGLQKRH